MSNKNLSKLAVTVGLLLADTVKHIRAASGAEPKAGEDFAAPKENAFVRLSDGDGGEAIARCVGVATRVGRGVGVTCVAMQVIQGSVAIRGLSAPISKGDTLPLLSTADAPCNVEPIDSASAFESILENSLDLRAPRLTADDVLGERAERPAPQPKHSQARTGTMVVRAGEPSKFGANPSRIGEGASALDALAAMEGPSADAADSA